MHDLRTKQRVVDQASGASLRILTQFFTVLHGPGVGIEALLQSPREGALWCQRIVNGQDWNIQIFGPVSQIHLRTHR